MTIMRNALCIFACCACLQGMAQAAENASGNDAQEGLSAEPGVSVEVREQSMPRQPLRESRLWVPASQEGLKPFLVTAALRAMDNPDCRAVLYGSVNEFRTEHEEPTFTILCMQNPRHTFNLIFPRSVLMPTVPEEVRKEAEEAEVELDRLRNLLQSDATPPDNVPEPEVLLEEEEDQPPPEVF